MKKINIFLAAFILFACAMGCRKESLGILNFASVTPNDFLSAGKYDQLVVEIQYPSGYQPAAATIDNLKDFLQGRLNKPGGILVTQKTITGGRSFYSLTDIQKIENANRTVSLQGTVLSVYIFFADGDYAQSNGNSKVLGITYGSSSMVIFEKTIKDFSGGIAQPPTATLETTVTEHELGHVMGLVNNGTPMQSPHQDNANGRHCNDKNCLMYYSVETSDIVANLLGGSVPALDQYCLDDLRGNGGK
ncbi:MAG TPA: peptidase [Bacteroidia bacterium]|jgi:hypothetical protein|nr:peptidase [Bacteroidia bacterium]